jgi:hypothetical protein
MHIRVWRNGRYWDYWDYEEVNSTERLASGGRGIRRLPYVYKYKVDN